jgi:GGDEF domain-containing protein
MTLRGVADLLLKHSRGINIICRYGGDESVIPLVETPKAGPQIYADWIRHVLARHDFAHGHLLSASFGIASLPEDGAAAVEDLIRAADEALYTASGEARTPRRPISPPYRDSPRPRSCFPRSQAARTPRAPDRRNPEGSRRGWARTRPSALNEVWWC